MTDKWATQRQQLSEKVRESEDAVQKDRQVRMEDAKDYQHRYDYLKTFRDENKKVGILYISGNTFDLCIIIFVNMKGQNENIQN